MRRLALLLLLAAAGCHDLAPESTEADQSRTWGEPATLVKIADERLKESSGVAASRIRDGVFFTHNDSGDSARFFRFDESGKVTGSYTLRGARNVDWEDMASATLGGQATLFIGDIGDNAGKRSSITVYRLAEPAGASGDIADYDTFTFTYPDRPHNAEALMAHPETGDLYIVAKSDREKSQVFRAKASGGRYPGRLEEVGTVSVGGAIDITRLITGGDISPDGKHVVVRTYMAAYEWPFSDWLKTKPVKIKTNVDIVGEAICYTRDGRALITTAELSPCLVSKIALR